MITELLSHPVLLHIGTWLLHFTWQAGVLGLLLWLVQPLLQRHSAHVRYTACWLVFALMLVLPSMTLLHALGEPVPSVEPVTLSVAETPADVTAAPLATQPTAVLHPEDAFPMPAALTTLYQLRPYLVLLWFIGICVYAGSFRRGLVRTHLLKHTGIPCREDVIARITRRIGDQMGILQRVVVRLTDHIDQPVLIGWVKPVILLPAGLIAGLTPQQIEAILAHELAHVKRHDYALSVLQSLLETIFFFHPAVWWISHRITVEREFCCDDLAVKTMGNKATYLRALVTLETLRTTGLSASPALSMHDGSLLSRVKRLAAGSASSPSPFTRLRIALMFMIGLVVMLFISLPSTSSSADTPSALPPETRVPSPADSSVSTRNHDAVPIPANPLPVFVNEVMHNDSIPSLHPLMAKGKMTSGFGMRYHPMLNVRRMHTGIDFMARIGTRVYATAAGTIKTVDVAERPGKYIVIEHADGYETRYYNLSRQIVDEGQAVAKGEQIGASGNSGLSTGPHLHYEVRRHSKPMDPLDYLPSELIGLNENDTPSGHPLGNDKITPIATFGMRHHPILKIRRMHAGLDFRIAERSPVYATADGEVQAAGNNAGLGKHVKLTHKSKLITVYGHLSDFAVEVGQQLNKGDLLGYSGNTGLSQAPHLHYEVRNEDRKPLDPLYFLPKQTIALSIERETASAD